MTQAEQPTTSSMAGRLYAGYLVGNIAFQFVMTPLAAVLLANNTPLSAYLAQHCLSCAPNVLHLNDYYVRSLISLAEYKSIFTMIISFVYGFIMTRFPHASFTTKGKVIMTFSLLSGILLFQFMLFALTPGSGFSIFVPAATPKIVVRIMMNDIGASLAGGVGIVSLCIFLLEHKTKGNSSLQ